jgi:hypothetical protein
MSKYKWYNYRVAKYLKGLPQNLGLDIFGYSNEYVIPEGVMRGGRIRVDLNNDTLEIQEMGHDESARLCLLFIAAPGDILSVNGYTLPPLEHYGHYMVDLSHNYIRMNIHARNNQFERQNTGVAWTEAVQVEGPRNLMA